MKTIIAGSRSIWEKKLVEDAIAESGFNITEVVSGCASGVDSIGEDWAVAHRIPVRLFPADWKFGKSGGPMRNKEMADYSDALIAVWDGKSKGTANMIKQAQQLGLKVFVKQVTPICT